MKKNEKKKKKKEEKTRQLGKERGINLPLESTCSHIAKSKGFGEEEKKERVEEETVEGGLRKKATKLVPWRRKYRNARRREQKVSKKVLRAQEETRQKEE